MVFAPPAKLNAGISVKFKQLKKNELYAADPKVPTTGCVTNNGIEVRELQL